jgi:hypothetical protein
MFTLTDFGSGAVTFFSIAHSQLRLGPRVDEATARRQAGVGRTLLSSAFDFDYATWPVEIQVKSADKSVRPTYRGSGQPMEIQLK